MEIVLQHTNETYRNFFIGAVVTIIITSIPAIAKLIKCRYEFAEYKFKDKLLWIIPIIFFLVLFFNAGLYMIDYTFDMKDVHTVLIEDVDINNEGCFLIYDHKKFHVSRGGYFGEGFSEFMESEVKNHLCEIESYKTSNEVIRIKVLD